MRYLVLDDIGPCEAWGNLSASKNDIIQYTLVGWTVSFDASEMHSSEYLVNLKSGKQLRFMDGAWIVAIDGDYNPGFWRIHL